MIYDVAIFGGGVVGTSLFSKLTRIGKKVILLEKATDVSTGASKANSGICHAGYDCEPNTLKAKLNVRGNYLMENLCNELSVPFFKCGSYVVGNDLDKLEKLVERGKFNGVKNLEIIKENLKEEIPNLKDNFKYALYAQDAGIVNPYMLTIALAEEAVINGGDIRFEFFTTKIQKNTDFFEIFNEKETINAKVLINASGAGYNDIATVIGSEEYPLTFKRGEYFVLDKNTDFIYAPIFPLPTEKGKGILATPTCAGNILFGPTSEKSEYDTMTTAEALKQIKVEINEKFDNVPWHKVIREFSGIRVSCGDDFIIEKSKKVENVINICGINSPGLTSAPAIAEYVCEILNYPLNEKQFKRRENYRIQGDRNAYIENDSRYGKIVCRCEVISEGEIVKAIHSPLKPRTVDAIKRRVRPGMGRCQGGFCTCKVCEIIARETGIAMEEVLKENLGSEIIKG